MAARGPDLPPLLEVGWHRMSMADIRRLCVDNFPLSTTRAGLMDGLEAVVTTLVDAGIVGDLWINGSFTTEKIDPKDTDVVLHVDGHSMYECGTQQQRRVIDWIIINLKESEFRCDSYHLFTYHAPHSLVDYGEWDRAYWMRQFGFSREHEQKGIAIVSIPSGAI
jgi:hypothetical protein